MAAESVPGELCRESDVQFRVLEWDRGPEFWGAKVPFTTDPRSANCRWFCVRAVRRCDGRPLRIADYDVSVTMSGVDDRDVVVDEKEGWCHYNFIYTAKPGLQLITVSSGGHVVVERVVLFTHGDQELYWTSRGEGADGLAPKKLAAAHLGQGKRKQGWGDLQKFRQWAATDSWAHFGPAHSHYDWWMFPIHARASKPEFAVGTGEVSELQADAAFMNNYREGVHLMLRSWGWDLETGSWCHNRHPQQGWRNWSVRLGKVALSLATFQEMLLFNKVRDFLRALLDEENAGRPYLTRESGHTELGGRIVVEEQFGVHPRRVLLL